MAICHRQDDLRSCGATTIATGQNFVFVDGKLWSVEGDVNTHGGGALIASKSFIKINGKSVIVVNDNAFPDSLCGVKGQSVEHCNPKAVTGSSTVNVT